MQLGTKGRYAVMALIQLSLSAREKSPTHPIPLSHIAQEQEISLLYLEQLFSKLRRYGLVISIRGAGGGYVLARPAGEISIADIMDAAGERLRATRCASKDKEEGCMRNKNRCMVHHLWASLTDRIYDYLGSVSLEDVAKDAERRHLLNDHSWGGNLLNESGAVHVS